MADDIVKFERVFVVQDFSRYDLILLEKLYGELCIVHTKDFPTHSNGNEWLDRTAFALKDFSDNDALLLVGDPVLVGIAFYEAASRCKIINTLKWSKSASSYYLIKVDLERKK